MKSVGRAICVGLLVGTAKVGTLIGQPAVNTLVCLGAGDSGPWTTEYVLTNPGHAPAFVAIMGSGPEFHICPGVPCLDQATLTVLPGQTVVTGGPRSGFPVFFVRSIDGPDTVVRARIYNAASPSQAVDLPIFRVASLEALNPRELVFPIRPKAMRTNLLLINLHDAGQPQGLGDVLLRIHAFAADGEELARADLFLGFGQFTYIVDLARFLGVDGFDEGHVRVEKTAGSGVFWGLLPSRHVDGSISATVGLIP